MLSENLHTEEFLCKKNPLKSVRAIVRIRSSYLDMMGGTVLILIYYADHGYWSAPELYPSQEEWNAISCSKVQKVGLVPAVCGLIIQFI